MGKFQLCIESTVREVNSLLVFHNVHPQVRADVQRRLQRLVYRIQDYMGTLAPGYCESAEDVCAAVVQKVVDDTLRNVLPGVELVLEEKRSAALQQRTRDLEMELCKSERRCSELEEVLERFRKAHQLMLRCYFREVLVLRYKLQEALWRRRTHGRRAQSAQPYSHIQESQSRSAFSVVPGSQGPDLGDALAALPQSQNMSLSEDTADVSASLVVCDVVTFPDAQSVVANETGHDITLSLVTSKGATAVPTTTVKPVSGNPATLFAELLQPPPTLATTTSTVVNADMTADTPKVSVKSNSNSKKIHASAVKRNLDTKSRNVQTVGTQTVPFMGDDSVDAIFDYERYIQQLNSSQRRGSESSFESEMATLSVKKFALKSPRGQQEAGFQLMRQRLMEAWERAGSAAWKHPINRGGLSTSSSRPNISSMDLMREVFLMDLTEIHQGVQKLQEQHFKDMTELQNAMRSIESQVEILLGFFGTYAEEVSRLAVALSSDEGTANDMSNGALVAKYDPYRRRVVMDYFTVTALTGALAEVGPEQSEGRTMEEMVMQQLLQQRQEHINFWENNPVTLRARAAFAELQAAAMRRWEEASRRRQGGTTIDMLPTVLGNDLDNLSAFTGGSKNGIEHEEDSTALRSLSREDKLKTLVQLRMQRIAHRARHRSRLHQLAEAARMGRRGKELYRILREAASHEQTVDLLTRKIDKLLRDLGLSGAVLDSERAFFTKNLAFSPYLCDPTDEMQESEVVYVPLPVNARDADDLCATLCSNEAGYVIFKDEVIPIANVKYDQRTDAFNRVGTAGGQGDDAAKSRAAGRRGPHRVVPFHGTVIEYYRGVQLGRPLGERQGPMYVFWDTEQKAFFLVEEEADAEKSPTRRVAITMKNQGPQQKLERQRNVHLSTILMHPPLPEPERREPAMNCASLVPVTPLRTVSKVTPPPVLTYSVDKKASNFFPLQQQGRCELPPCFSSASPTARLAHPLIVQPNKEEKDLLKIESLSARRVEGEARKATPSDGTVTVLARLKGAERQRQQKALTMAQRIPRGGETQKASNERFLRMRFPCISLSAAPASE
ncbi:hypothetical protein TraAM80_04852 [Trypanosoma rangeli]|uniref:Uncharacterized protein n=1 Tax=Trypanosoma rangeli TaxID=5698 RepID=A0A422NI19_TRYRA|nr:uncharacterized protein TraAM80_04852 [Trypanosoma rangeli]RNF05122.1 hypothetical protein TraAM80_04852 [Trypanosoma rangeli]|eukprot:RNF05122.1 hypothetical protein TraAM80_04852 [Trypanosoma rangeli]